MKTEMDALKAVRRDWSALGEIPEALRTPDVCLDACRQCGMALAAVPDAVLSPEICLAAVREDPAMLSLLPERLLTPDLVAEACAATDEEAPSPLRFVPDAVRSESVCLAAVRENGLALRFVPDAVRTPAVCMAAVQDNGRALCLVPEALRTEDLCREALRQSEHVRGDVPERLRAVLADAVREASYDRAWLGPSMWTLGEALECAGRDLGESLDGFFRDFILSGLASEFETGLPLCDGGCSGLELVQLVLEWRGETLPEDAGGDGPWLQEPSPEYRAGWALAWYQWKRNEPFMEILRDVSASEIVAMPELPCRKAALSAFGEALDALRTRRRCQNEN